MSPRCRAKHVAAQLLPNGQNRRTPYSDEWYTPPSIVQALGAFDLDPCAGPVSDLARVNFRLPEVDGLHSPWFGRVFLNPPFSQIPDWVARFADHCNGILLCNARIETAWFQTAVAVSDAVLFPRKRIPFARPCLVKAHNPMTGQALIAMGHNNAELLHRSRIPGLLFRTPTTIQPASAEEVDHVA